MKTLRFVPFFLFCFIATMTWAAPFFDDFNRADSDDLGNEWETQTDGTIEISITDEEVLIEGQQGTDWVRSGISRAVEDETKIFFDFLANNNFNIHIRIDDTVTGADAYIDVYAPPGGAFSYANSEDGGWPGWTNTGKGMIANDYNTLSVEQEDDEFAFILNDEEMIVLENSNLQKITEVLFSVDSAAGTAGNVHIDNVVIGNPSEQSEAIEAAGKLSSIWAELKK